MSGLSKIKRSQRVRHRLPLIMRLRGFRTGAGGGRSVDAAGIRGAEGEVADDIKKKHEKKWSRGRTTRNF